MTSKRDIMRLCLLGVPSIVSAGALQDGEPTLDNYNLLGRVTEMLRTIQHDQLRPHISKQDGRIFAYYLNQISFVGRCETVAGPRNIVFCGYTRSAAYTDGTTGPAHGHRFVLFLNDKLELDFFNRTEAWIHEVSLDGSILAVEHNKLDLRTQSGFKYCRDVAPL